MISKLGEELVNTDFKECECPQCKSKIEAMVERRTNQLNEESRDIISVNCDYCGCSGSIVKEYDKNQELKDERSKLSYGKGAYLIKDDSYKHKVIFHDEPSISSLESFIDDVQQINLKYYKDCYFNIWDEKEQKLINIFRESIIFKESKNSRKELFDLLKKLEMIKFLNYRLRVLGQEN